MSGTEKPGDDLVIAIREDMRHLEAAFTGISAALDNLPREHWPLFLAKLSLLLADRLGDPEAIAESIETARLALDP